MLGPLLPIERILRHGLTQAERNAQGFFVALPYVLSRLGHRLLTRVPTAAIKVRLADWVRWGDSRLHIGTRFLGAGDWSGISSSVLDSPVVREAYAIFQHGLNYQATPAYARYRERAQEGNPVRRNNIALSCPKLIDAYFQRFVDLFRSVQLCGVQSRKEYVGYAGLSRPSAIRRLQTEWGEKEIGIAIGAEGQVYRLPGGQHRAAIAIVLGLDTLPVQVRLVHSKWVLQRLAEHGGGIGDAIARGIQCGPKANF
jgi:hypothetical protein